VRHKGEGSVYWSKSQKTWVGKITLPDGRRISKRNKDKQIVKDWLFEQRRAIDEHRLPPDGSVTFNEFADRFLEDVAKHTMKEKTVVSYESYLRLHIRPTFGRMKLSAIAPHHIQRLYSQKLSDGLSKKTVLHIHTYLRRVLNQAVKWELIYRNPCSSVTPPKVDKHSPSVWSIEQAQTFLRATQSHKWYAIYLIALTTGARRGEILGMEWKNVNWARNTISIQKTVVEVKGVAKISDPKTATSRRTISLPTVVMDQLKRQSSNSGFIFQSEAGTPVHPRNLLRHFYSVLDDLSVPRIRFHDLRHTCATLLFADGVHPKKVQELLGHASIVQTIDTYTSYIPALDSETADKMDAIFN
jgi:integrase